MDNISAEKLLLALSIMVVVSYLFLIVSKFIKVPSVLLLMAVGIGLRYISETYQLNISVPAKLTEFLGIVGLIMIVLEAGLDLKLSRNKLILIRQSFFAALVIFTLTTIFIAATLYYILHEPIISCTIYAIPLAIMSSSIVIPSLHQLTPEKKEFLVYEASFSDIIGILVFNYFLGDGLFSAASIGIFFLNIFISILLSLVFSFIMFLILNKNKLNVKFFLVFALLIFLYVEGKILHLPSLIIILIFGLWMNNWELIPASITEKYFPIKAVNETNHLLHALTAEASFLLRTFFFFFFGFSIDLHSLAHNSVLLIGSIIIVILLITRFFYLRFFLKERIVPEVFFIPRGLITILLFYKIPVGLQLPSFREGILFFVILLSSLILMVGMIFYKQSPSAIVEED
ncbi:MAG: sodium:proton exchanger [Hydrotalea flava]|uniref:cation:proton antiporter domain-containing protein n=1 Tax=Hydrotalea lipotrueae TaxID=2803817 RepID=UPI0016A2F755|nr:cation:proton antiporter [Hydrotalea lipotrueae]MBY0347710.1 cation:proton antiporter [Hydrotalea flava]NIM35528.1 sodium:proton exchanger [Hydrotalea flava]NIM38385.1 sodium:proton exchanger [Hydrotalea flava]NIN03555.1 sodium:proton exchanger [Hydrotalea flava]NIN15242.1 sodium:proton exchanger [Hydrotalea flava]